MTARLKRPFSENLYRVIHASVFSLIKKCFCFFQQKQEEPGEAEEAEEEEEGQESQVTFNLWHY